MFIHSSTQFTPSNELHFLQDIVFPLMSYSEQDADMWDNDPYEYIRIKFDIFEDFVSPVTAAQTLLHSACKKRKEMLQKTMALLLQIIQVGFYLKGLFSNISYVSNTIKDVALIILFAFFLENQALNNRKYIYIFLLRLLEPIPVRRTEPST